jgi:DNA (cytosine-5)-methyltransferase 1
MKYNQMHTKSSLSYESFQITSGLEEAEVYRSRLKNDLPGEPRPRLIDLFAGAGGMSAGFTHFFGHRFDLVWANDFNAYAVETYNTNFGDHCISGDIVDILNDGLIQIPNADVVIGGPPCQGFSLLNKNREEDPRKQLWRPFMDIVRLSGADIFVMENVPQLIGSLEHDKIIEKSTQMGFSLAWARLCAADYGVPQSRWRAFIIGCKYADPSHIFPPKRTNFAENNGIRRTFSDELPELLSDASPLRTVRDAIGDLPAPVGTEIRSINPPLDLQFGRNPTEKSLNRYKAIPEEGMNRFDLQRRALHLTPECWIKKKSGGTDLFGRLWWDKPSVTIRTEFFKPEKGRYLHPVQHRPITHREAARIQTFPDDFVFKGSKIEIAKQIGNAVPPLLAARIADCVYALLRAKEN